MSHSDVSKIKERLGIKEVVEQYIKLEKAGKNYKGRCPFHNEKTPSFFVSPDRDSYYCFGCSAKGDIFTFVENYEGTDFRGALKILADRAGVQIKNYSKEVDSKTKRMKALLELSTKYFVDNLEKNPESLEYLKTRGLSEKTIKDWRIGFALDGWHNLSEKLKKDGYAEDELVSAGLIRQGNKDNYYDYFRNRIMFPIFDSVGDVVAFTGRIFGSDEETAKYINSPESILFKKSELLYGFDRAKANIRKNDFSILVEGQMDTIMCHQVGYTNAIASSGTALTEKQLQIVSKISQQMVIAYDSDSAGFRASEKAWQMALSLGLDIKIAPIPEGNDPADIIKDDPKKWKDIIKDSKHIIEVLIDQVKKDNKNDREVGKFVSTRIIPYLHSIESKIDKDHFVNLVADSFGINAEAIYGELKSYKPTDNIHQENKETERDTTSDRLANNTRKLDRFAIEKKIIGIIEWQKKSSDSIIDAELLESEAKEIIKEEYELIKKSISDYIEDIIFTLENSYDLETEKGKNILIRDSQELVINLKLKYLVKQREELLMLLKETEKTGEDKETDDLLEKISNISKEIQEINQKN